MYESALDAYQTADVSPACVAESKSTTHAFSGDLESGDS